MKGKHKKWRGGRGGGGGEGKEEEGKRRRYTTKEEVRRRSRWRRWKRKIERASGTRSPEAKLKEKITDEKK